MELVGMFDVHQPTTLDQFAARFCSLLDSRCCNEEKEEEDDLGSFTGTFSVLGFSRNVDRT